MNAICASAKQRLGLNGADDAQFIIRWKAFGDRFCTIRYVDTGGDNELGMREELWLVRDYVSGTVQDIQPVDCSPTCSSVSDTVENDEMLCCRPGTCVSILL
jgi:hypothetical protein